MMRRWYEGVGGMEGKYKEDKMETDNDKEEGYKEQ